MTEYLCLDGGHRFSLRQGAYPEQCPVRTCRSYEVISEDKISEILALSHHFIQTTKLGVLPTLDVISAIFHRVGLRKFRPENTMKLAKIVLNRLNVKGEVSFRDISIGAGVDKSVH